MNTSEQLHKAADLIEREGWWSKPLGGTSIYCAANAICAASEGLRMTEPTHAFIAYLGLDGLGDIFRWNDAPGRTTEDVVAALRACALEQELREADLRGPLNTPPVPQPRKPSPDEVLV